MTFVSLAVMINGRHQTYRVEFNDGSWKCECDFFLQRGVCSHTMAVEKVLARTGTALAQSHAVEA